MDHETKTLSLELKQDGAEGDFVATFSSFNVVDHDGDVTRPGAFEEGKAVLVGAYQHAMSNLPVGKGVLRSDDERAQIHGAFNLKTAGGRDTYEAVKNAGDLMEWSYIFRVEQSSEGDFDAGDKTLEGVRFLEKVDVWSVDPVLKGAGIGTGTESVKSAPKSYHEHAASLVAEVEAFMKRTDARIEERAGDGRSLSADDRERLTALMAGLGDAASRLGDALRDGKADEIDIQHELLRFERTRALESGLAVPAV